MLNLAIKIVLWLVSVGWLAPLCLAAMCLWPWLETEVAPVVYTGKHRAVNSFPLLMYGQRLFWIGFIWGAVAVVGWVTFLVARLGVNPPRNS